MDNKIDRIETKIDRISEQQSEMNAVLVKQQEQLAYHIRRTDLLEEQMKPIVEHVYGIKMLAKIVGVITAVIAVAKLFI